MIAEESVIAEEPASRPGPRLSQAQRTARTRSRLLRASLDLVAERGYERASLAAIGERAGYSRGVVNHCFGSKSALLGALVEEMFERWGDESLRPVVEGRVGADALCAVIDSVRSQAHQAPVELKAFYLLLFEALGPLPELRPRFAELHRRMRAGAAHWIRAGVEAGVVGSDVDAEAQAGLFVGAFRGAMYQWLLDPEHVDLDRLLDEQQRSVRRVLEPAAGD
ncbi:MAG: TetR/AcrR family transcriptional regulator [Myxococcota bacterium]|nr:TetR/AcrR family transcriptional regulator [Myxococcota bacterium]